MPKLRIEQRNQKRRDVVLDDDALSIGRGVGNTLHFRDPWLSREHARIMRASSGFQLEDLASRNGTYLNGRKLEAPRLLGHGDVVSLGDVQLTYLDEASTGLHVAEAVALDTSGTMMIPSEDLRYDQMHQVTSSTQDSSLSQSGADLLPAIHNVTSALIRHFPIDELVEKILDLVLEAVPAERAALLLTAKTGGATPGIGVFDQQTWENAEPEPAEIAGLEVKARRGYGEGDEVRISRTIVQAVLEQRQVVLTMDAQSDARFGQAVSIMMQGIRSVVCAPMINADRQVMGLIYLDDRVSRGFFNEVTLRLVGLLANLAAVKIDNSFLLEDQLEKRRMAEQLAVGAQIQRGLLPSSDPDVAGYEICGINRSCFEIGGDYYDYILKEDGTLAVVVADISGKGVGAALLMAVLQASLRALVHTAAEPAELVRQLNRVLVRNSPDNKFATLFYAELDAVNHRLSYVSGGHNPTLLAIDGVVTYLDSTGPIVGLVPGATFICKTVELPVGATVVLYTDGVTELENDRGQELGLEPLDALICSEEAFGPSQLIEEVDALMRRFAGRDHFDDDTTLVVLQRQE